MSISSSACFCALISSLVKWVGPGQQIAKVTGEGGGSDLVPAVAGFSVSGALPAGGVCFERADLVGFLLAIFEAIFERRSSV